MSEGARTFAALAPRTGARGCFSCGKPTAAIVAVAIRRTAEKGQAGAGEQLGSRQHSFCEPCAVKLFLDLQERIG